MPKMMHPFEFAAKMWRMAPAMIAARDEVFGEQILFTGEELADIIAFVHDDAKPTVDSPQATLSLPPKRP